MQHFIGCDVHTRNQVVTWIEEETGEIKKRRLEHEGKEAREFYAQFPRGTVVGIEATFPAHGFERLRGELGHELWVGDAAPERAAGRAGPPGRAGAGTGPGGGRSRPRARGGGAVAHPSGSGQGGVAGLRADGGTDRALPQQPQTGELLGAESARELLGWSAAPGLDW